MSDITNITILEKAFAAYKSGETKDAPIYYKDFGIKVNDSGKQVVLSVEEIDRDGEVVEMSGMILPDWTKENGIPLIDSHNAHTSVVTNGLGAIRNPRVEIINGKKSLVGDPDFAPTPAGTIAKILYMGVDGGKPYFTNVSMGFIVYDYDNATKTIKSWEPFEGSLVTIGANMGSRFVDKALNTETEIEVTETTETVAKNLARFKAIHAPFKEFTKLFLSDSFCEKIGYVKDGDVLVDINNVFSIIDNKIKTVEAPQIDQQDAEAPQPEPEKEPEIDPSVQIAEAIAKMLESLS